jgi:hypothetical protein
LRALADAPSILEAARSAARAAIDAISARVDTHGLTGGLALSDAKGGGLALSD